MENKLQKPDHRQYFTEREYITALDGYIDELEAVNDKLQAFKDYVHKRLDDMGIEKDPESDHKAAGCRIGGRLDILESAQRENEEMRSVSELSTDDMADLIDNHVTKMWGGLEMASVEHFLKTGVINGSFRLRLLAMLQFAGWKLKQKPTIAAFKTRNN